MGSGRVPARGHVGDQHARDVFVAVGSGSNAVVRIGQEEHMWCEQMAGGSHRIGRGCRAPACVLEPVPQRGTCGSGLPLPAGLVCLGLSPNVAASPHLLEVAAGSGGDLVGPKYELLRHAAAQGHGHLVLQIRPGGGGGGGVLNRRGGAGGGGKKLFDAGERGGREGGGDARKARV